MSDRVAVMSEGHILQIGAPHEIYNRPNNRFVADFIGDTNFISADVIDRQTNEVRVRLPGGGDMTIPTPHDLPAGNAVTLAIRPEQARIATAGDPVAMQGNGASTVGPPEVDHPGHGASTMNPSGQSTATHTNGAPTVGANAASSCPGAN